MRVTVALFWAFFKTLRRFLRGITGLKNDDLGLLAFKEKGRTILIRLTE